MCVWMCFGWFVVVVDKTLSPVVQPTLFLTKMYKYYVLRTSVLRSVRRKVLRVLPLLLLLTHGLVSFKLLHVLPLLQYYSHQ
jgi:hypothetical protein